MPASLNRMLMTADAVGGVWTVATDLADGLARHGVAVTLAVLGPPPSAAQRARAAAVPNLTLVETGEPLDWLAEDAESVRRSARSVSRLAREHGAELVHLNAPSLAVECFDVPVVGVCHSCMATWWRAVRQGALPADFTWRTALLAHGYAACDALIAPSHAFSRDTAETYGMPAPLVIPNGRRALPGHAALRNIVFTAGRLWDEGKNVATLDEAAVAIGAPVIAAGPLTGPGGQGAVLHRLTSVGSQDEAGMAAWLSRAAVFVSVALYEPFGLAVLEAAQAGVPLVLSDIPTFRELWQDAALFVPPRDPAALAAAVNRLLAAPALSRRLGAAARERAARYSVEAMVERTLAAYASLLRHLPVAA